MTSDEALQSAWDLEEQVVQRKVGKAYLEALIQAVGLSGSVTLNGSELQSTKQGTSMDVALLQLVHATPSQRQQAAQQVL